MYYIGIGTIYLILNIYNFTKTQKCMCMSSVLVIYELTVHLQNSIKYLYNNKKYNSSCSILGSI